MPQRTRGTSARPLARLLEASDHPVWLIDSGGQLAYVSAACGRWLGVTPEDLLGRRAVAGIAASDDWLDRLAATLSAPPGLSERGLAEHTVHPPPLAAAAIAARPAGSPRAILFVLLDQTPGGPVLAIADRPLPPAAPPDLDVAMQIRERLAAWRLRQPKLASLAVAQGTSPAAQRLRHQVELATSTREHAALIGPRGCGSEAIARVIHRGGAAQPTDPTSLTNPIVTVDGPLMDAELLDATIAPAIHLLAEEPHARVTLLVRGIDQTAGDAQDRLNRLAEEHGQRLRLLVLQSAASASRDRGAAGIHPALATRVSVLQIDVPPLAARCEDIPVIATALLDNRRATGEGTADRFSRAALDALVLYPWPENVEELDAAVRQAVRSCRASAIQPEHLPLAVRSYQPRSPGHSAARSMLNLDRTLARVEQQLIERAVQQAEGNRAEAARLLGISRARLLRRMEESSAEEGD